MNYENKIITVILKYPDLLKNRIDSDILIETYNNILTINPVTLSGLTTGLAVGRRDCATRLEYTYIYKDNTPTVNRSNVPLDEAAYTLHKAISCNKLSYIKNKPEESSVMIPKLTGSVLYLEVCTETDMVVSALLGNNLLLSRWDIYRINNISVLFADVDIDDTVINLDVGNSIYKYCKDNQLLDRELTRSQIDQLRNDTLNILELVGVGL